MLKKGAISCCHQQAALISCQLTESLDVKKMMQYYINNLRLHLISGKLITAHTKCLTYERGHSAEVTGNWFTFDDDDNDDHH